MERENALSGFQEKTMQRRKEFQECMEKRVLDHAEKLEEMVKDGMGRLGEAMERQGKEYVCFLYLALPKADVIRRRYQFLLHAMDLSWYLDEDPAEVYISAGDLFEPLNGLWDYLLEESREYMGMVNSYDVQNLVFEELKPIHTILAEVLRYHLREWEQKQIFEKVQLYPQWLMAYGEYRDQTEIILRTEQVEKEPAAWKEELRKASHNPKAMVFGYWYQHMCEDSRLKELDLRFITFEKSKLKNLLFEKCDLEGARFPESSITGCSFEDCRLWGADFTGCSFERVSFQGAELTGAIFPAESVSFLNLDPEQLQTILLKREEQ